MLAVVPSVPAMAVSAQKKFETSYVGRAPLNKLRRCGWASLSIRLAISSLDALRRNGAAMTNGHPSAPQIGLEEYGLTSQAKNGMRITPGCVEI